jgi:glutaminase
MTAIRSPIQTYLERLHARHADLRSGEVATYIPELGKANPEWFAICLATTDGHLYAVGDARQTFTIQSISKPLTYGLALEDHGREAVLAKIGVEPSGDAFNSISLAPATGCPVNPMINAGAIAAASLVAGRSAEDRLARLLAVFSLYAGRRLSVDEGVYRSESATGHRNRAIGHLLRNFDVLTSDPDPALELYFKQCSILVDCRDLALIAATLANDGVHPITGERAVRNEVVDDILSVMTTCGMYDYAGEWVYAVGMPAKSGVAGGVMAVLPGQLGLGVFSPRLDARGNSVRGVAVCTAVSKDFGLHFLRVPRSARAVIRGEVDLGQTRSRRLRNEVERGVLDRAGKRVRIYRLQGDVAFAGVETVVRRIVDAGSGLAAAVIDVSRVARIEPCTVDVLADLVQALDDTQRLVLVGTAAHPSMVRRLEERVTAAGAHDRLQLFFDLDAALEWCEERLLAEAGVHDEPSIDLADHEMCRGLGPDELRVLGKILEPRSFQPGDVIVRQGERAADVFLLMRGRVSVTVELPRGERKRLSTVSPGMVFGELTVVDRSARTADVRADTAVECLVLPGDALDRVGRTQPRVKIAILENLLRNVHRTVLRLNREVTALEG